LFIGLLAAAAPLVWLRSVTDGGSDFFEYYAAGRYVLEHGARQPDTILAYYWPSLDVAWAALAWMPLGMAAAVWCAVGCWCWIGLLGAVGRYLLADVEDGARRQSLLAAGLLVMPIVILHLCLGAFHVLMLWWMVAGLGRVSQGRDRSGAVLLGLAVWVKLLPLLGAGYLLWKRKWRPALLSILVALAIDAALSLAALGPQAAWQWHERWWRQQASDTTRRVLTSPTPLPEHRFKNQSPAAVLRRLLTPLLADPWKKPDRVTLANLSTSQVVVLYYTLVALLGLGIVAVARRPAGQTSAGQWGTEIALVALSTLWFSPVVWSYHNTAVLPAMAAVMGRERRHPRLVWAIVVLWLIGMSLFASSLARGLGTMLWMSLGLGAALVWMGQTRTADTRAPEA